ncbi:MAG: zeta toxin family protein [Clostridia bacterium]|nr:zeta toxin family protein [Clostridia bacterium]
MAAEKKYVIFAGINGVGKTALHKILEGNIHIGERISIDDIAASLGDWRDTTVQIKAARMAMAELKSAIAEGRSFHQETTLPGEAVVRFADLAKEKGYYIVLNYIGVASLEIAKESVRLRVEKGGHGIDEKVMEKRYEDMKKTLIPLLDRCDEVYFYDNTESFRQVAMMLDHKLADCAPNPPEWLSEILKEIGIEP